MFEYLSAMILSSARIAPAFFLLPFFNNNVLSSAIRMPVTLLVALALWPHAPEARPLSTRCYILDSLLKKCLLAYC
ncbi:flagellar biosynthetic protein FliR [Candidatus Fukatsuia symbiotica]|uniref:flagellar biosynthetic protein FliR n=1 Tax=Candidatus Fukatsuia symbiotica TaxID=1878942 RepID=UPI001F087E80|nr:flagellar biosynthetic protein FliR [Candidatus Fukatsuia symbiotica]